MVHITVYLNWDLVVVAFLVYKVGPSDYSSYIL